MKRALIFGFILGMASICMAERNEDNWPRGATYMRPLRTQVDENSVILFSTNITAGLNTVIAPDHWDYTSASITWPALVNYSTRPATRNGGRLYMAFQAVPTATNTAANLWWSLDAGVSTSTSPFLTDNQWWPPADWPFVWQSTVTVKSTSAYTIRGFIITEKKR